MTNREVDQILVDLLPGYKSVFTSTRDSLHLFDWAKLGQFTGNPCIAWFGPRNYHFEQDVPVFSFIRSTGETIEPLAMQTDGGSVPRVFWSLPGFGPWDFFPAYIVHAWEFKSHRVSFEEANITLAEGIYTLQKNAGASEVDLIQVEIIYRAVSSPIGKHIWDTKG
jgi:hypothetical protein